MANLCQTTMGVSSVILTGLMFVLEDHFTPNGAATAGYFTGIIIVIAVKS